ncbi:hypothetical protein ACQPYK_33905 [Streptosporangium sp. CA-135522]|uniref:hypothetical protein n=1 Tax=Streptosporangium sp. CA-135522 TaxID=3240072 RepID=UPI003D9434DB
MTAHRWPIPAGWKDFCFAVAIPGSAALLGAMVVWAKADVLAWAVLLVGVPLFVFAAPARLVVWGMAFCVLTVTAVWPKLTSVGGVDIYVGDAILLLTAVTALIRAKAVMWHRLITVVIVFAVFGVMRSDSTGAAAFLRMIEPLIAGVAVGMFLRPGADLWRDVRWIFVIMIATVPLVSDLSGRWAGFPGGPNEIGLVSVVVMVLGTVERNRPTKLLLIGAGLVGLVGSKGISATVALIAGLAMLARMSESGWFARTRMRRVNPLMIALAGMLAVAFVPVVRPDLATTVDIHVTQAGVFGQLFAKTDPLVGSGWANADQGVFVYTPYQDLHDVYLDITVYLGIAGIALFALLLWLALRAADPLSRALLVSVAVWFNTTGAFPGPGWGVLGMVIAAALCHARLRATAPTGPADVPVPMLPHDGTRLSRDLFEGLARTSENAGVRSC